MSKNLSKYQFSYIVKMDNFDKHINEMMTSISKAGVVFSSLKKIPTFIEIDVSPDLNPKKVNTVRQFLKRLRDFNEKNFVRFSTDLLWVMESDNADIFYSRNRDRNYYHDVSLFIEPTNYDSLYVSITIPFENNTHRVIETLSEPKRQSMKFRTMTSKIDICNQVEKHHNDTGFWDLKSTFDGDEFNLLIVPSREKQVFFKIPIWGLSLADAKLKYRNFQNKMNFLKIKHGSFVGEENYNADPICLLLEELCENETINEKYSVNKISYGLAELLLGCWASRITVDTVDNSSPRTLLFDVRNIEKDTFDVSIISVRKIKN